MEFLTNIITMAVGVLYPAFSTFKSLKNKAPQNRLIWLRYWVVFSCFYSGKILADVFLSWLPFYNVSKIMTILWLASSKAAGAQVVYFYGIEPLLRVHEKQIETIMTRYHMKLAGYFWTGASLVTVQSSGFLFQAARLYMEAANDSPNFAGLAIQAGEESVQNTVNGNVNVSGDVSVTASPATLPTQPYDAEEDFYSDNETMHVDPKDEPDSFCSETSKKTRQRARRRGTEVRTRINVFYFK